MLSVVPPDPTSPLETSVMRFMSTRLEITHLERAICVIAGPWGIGKTTAVGSFARSHSNVCVIIKVEQGAMSRGASPVFVLQQTIQALRPFFGRSPGGKLTSAYWPLRQMLHKHLHEWVIQQSETAGHPVDPRLTLIFDEAQYLSRDAIEMMRFWNDTDRTVTPFPVGLVFVGNSEFALEERANGQSVLSGAVRSRALFIESLDYGDVPDEDVSVRTELKKVLKPLWRGPMK